MSAPTETHHLVGNSLAPGGTAKGCAHNDTELRAYVNSGTIPNPDCPRIVEGNKPDFAQQIHPTIKFYFGCERELEDRPSERTYHDMKIEDAFLKYCIEHGLVPIAAIRASIYYKIGE